MSVRTPHVSVGRVGRQTARERAVALTRGDARWAALVGVVLVALLLLTWDTWGDLAHDTGYDFIAGQRVADGQLPYVDFTYLYGPLGAWLSGAAFAVLGTSVSSAVVLGLALTILAVGLTYRLAARLTPGPGAAIAAILTAAAAAGTGNISFVVPHAVSAPVAVVLSLATLLSAAAVARDGGRARLAQTGVLAGLVALTRPEFTAAIFVALGLWLVLRWNSAERRGDAVRDALTCLGVAIAIPAVVYGAFATKIGLSALINDNLVPRAQLEAGSDAVLKASAPLTAHSFAKLAGYVAVYALLLGAMAAAAAFARRGERERKLILGGLALAVLAGLAVLLARPEAVRSRMDFAYAWMPAAAAAGALLLALQARRARGAGFAERDQIALLTITFLAVLAAKTYAAFAPYPNPDFAQFASYAMPFAAIALCWLHLEVLPAMTGQRQLRTIGLAWVGLLAAISVALVVHDGNRESYEIRGPGGTLHATPAQGPAMQAAIERVLAVTKPGDPVLFAPQLTALYTLTERTNPLAEISLLPGALATPADEDAAIRRMDGVKVAVVDRRRLTEYDQGSFGETYNQRLGAWLHNDFRRTATFHGASAGATTVDIWERTAP